MTAILKSRSLLILSGAAGFTAFVAALAWFLYHLPTDSLEKLAGARPYPLICGLLLLGMAFVFRAFRLNLLLPVERRLSLVRGTMVSAAANVLYNVTPFRSGEVLALALFRRETRGSWGQSAGLLLLIKAVDISTALLAGASGVLWLLSSGGTAIARTATLAFGVAGAVFLVLLPFVGFSFGRWLQRLLTPGSRPSRLLSGLLNGVETARAEPRTYVLSFLAGIGYLGLHLAGIRLVLSALSFPVPVALVAAATVASVTAATAIPSPAGTFGSSEAGFAAALASTGIPLSTGFVLAAAVHLAIVLASTLVALPLLPGLFREVLTPAKVTATP